MTISSQLRQSEDNFKLALSITNALCERFELSREEAWSALSPNRTVEALQKHFKRERRRNDPLAQVKKPRTAFSFFTQENRAKVQAKNPSASFGELSRLVSADWKKLSDSQLKKYKQMESTDKERYQTERARVLAEVAQNAAQETTETPSTQTPTETPAATTKKATKSSKSSKTSTTTESTPATTAAPTKPSKSAKKASKGKGGKKSRATAQVSA
jgi:hypothetical protein